ncbi:MAG: metallophosphoesterase family protein [Chitinophagaceae bacterium]|nr:metallophosphoesterase family protein [Chitinophagaceae bacterium]
MRKFLQRILTNPVIRLADKYSSHPKRQLVFDALDKLYRKITAGNEQKGLLIPVDTQKDKFIIFSDLHKGAKNGADDFMVCEQTYLEALDYYEKNAFHYICLGDGEELWENNLFAVRAANKASIEKEKTFVQRQALTKVFGNHDLFWDADPFSGVQLKSMYGVAVKIYEGVVLQMQIEGRPLSVFLTHGHQGDEQSDGNWFSKFFVSRIWGPLQSYLRINPNTPAYNSQLKTLHNTLMYEWSSQQQGLILITGHTHQPVFESLTLLESLVLQLDQARKNNDLALVHKLEQEIKTRQVELPVALNLYDKILPTYFNSGCCCYSDGDITGIEIEGGCIRLIRWKNSADGCNRTILAEKKLAAFS